MSRPEYVATIIAKRDPIVAAQAMQRNWENPRFVARLQEYLHSDRNPFLNDAVRAKARDTLVADGYSMLNGGNGTGLTVPQRMLADRLGWPTEFIVRTKMPPGSGYPSHYKVDIADPTSLVGVEVDGHSHALVRRAALDVKKDEFLESLGWLVIRVTNREVMEDCEGRAQHIVSLTSKRPLATTLRMAS
jgi:hypothetical protein